MVAWYSLSFFKVFFFSENIFFFNLLLIRCYSAKWKKNLLWWEVPELPWKFSDRQTRLWPLKDKNKTKLRGVRAFRDEDASCCYVLSLRWSPLSLIHRHCSQWRHKVYEVWDILNIDILNYFLILLIKPYSWVCWNSELSTSVHQIPSGRMESQS